jgi:hypothetical protein
MHNISVFDDSLQYFFLHHLVTIYCINLLSVINKRERASWPARSLVRWRRGQLQRILEVPRHLQHLGSQ